MDDTAAAIATPPTEAADARAQISLVRLSRITPSATNPRRTFNEAQLAELTDSVRQHGVLQPLLVRPLVGTEERFELVCGERRYRAATAAGLREIPALVRPLTDMQVLEVQLIENLQREGLHELEEAEGYERLLQTHGYTADDLAAKVGKSRSYVYQRMKLTDLCEKARKAFYAGKLTFSTALLIARIPTPALQAKALVEITEHWQGGMSARQAADHVQRRYMLRLHDASFPKHDAQLVPAAGPCSTCPKRTGNSPDLFGDVESADVCTDPACFDSKREAYKARTAEKAKQEGREVITGKKAADKLHQDYVQLDKKDYLLTGSGKTYKQLLGKNAPQAVLVENSHGELVEALPKKVVVEALKDKGVRVNTGKRPAEEIERDRKRKVETAFRLKLFLTLVPAVVERKHYDLRPIALAMLTGLSHDARTKLAKAKGLDDSELLRKAIAGADQQMLYLILIEFALATELVVWSHSDAKAERMLALAKALEVDAGAIRRQVAAEAKPKKPPTERAARGRKPARGQTPPASPSGMTRPEPDPAGTVSQEDAPATPLQLGDTVKVRSREVLVGRTPHYRAKLPGLVGTVVEAFVDGRVRIKFGAAHQHKAVWLMAHEVERIEAPTIDVAAPAEQQASAQWKVGDRVRVRRDAKSKNGTRLKMVNREGVITRVNQLGLAVDFGNRTYGTRMLQVDQVERAESVETPSP